MVDSVGSTNSLFSAFRNLYDWLKQHHIDTDAVSVEIYFRTHMAENAAARALAKDIEQLKKVLGTTGDTVSKGKVYGIRFKFVVND